MKHLIKMIFACFIGFFIVLEVAWADSSAIHCSNDGSVCREQGTNLPLRVLPKPFSTIYKNPVVTKDEIVDDNVKAFSPLFAFKIKETSMSETGEMAGWYQVGRTIKNADGWMRASDVMQWRQPLVVVYTPKDEGLDGNEETKRKSVLMFNQLEALESFIEEAEEDPESAEKVYTDIANKKQVENIISKEPEAYVDFKKEHYIYPIISFKRTEINGNESLFLQLATQLPGQRSDDSNKTILSNKKFQNDALKKSVLKEDSGIKADVVFVMDLTKSMKPFIEETKKAVSSLAEVFSKDVDDLMLGLVGYRDDVNRIPEMEFTVKNFTPDMVDASHLITILQDEVRQAEHNSDDFQEEVFAGVQEAAVNSNWRENALHIIVLIGDASSHIAGGKSTIDATASTLKDGVIDQRNIKIIALHIQDPKFKSDHPVAKQQFETLATVNKEQGTVTYFPIPFEHGQIGAFSKAINDLRTRVPEYLGKKGRELVNKSIGGKVDSANPNQKKIDKMMAALLVEFVGGGTPPTDITGWVFDRDPTKPYLTSLETRILVSKGQLSKLHDALKDIETKYGEGKQSTENFFTSLQEASSGISKGSENITKIADVGLLPAFINDLPYQSYILKLSKETFGAIGSSERAMFEADLKAKIAAYKRISADASEWITLSDDPNAEEWCALPLNLLP